MTTQVDITINDLVDSAITGNVSDMKDMFSTLVRKSIDDKINAMRPDIHASIFNPKDDVVSEGDEGKKSDEKFHIKFKYGKTDQWFKTRDFGNKEEMMQYFWSKVKPNASEVQFHSKDGRMNEDTLLTGKE